MIEPVSNLRNRRNALGVSLREMARRCVVSPSYLSDLERGYRGIAEGTKHDILIHYGMSESEAFERVYRVAGLTAKMADTEA